MRSGYLMEFSGRKILSSEGYWILDVEMFLTESPTGEAGVRLYFRGVKELRIENMNGMVNIALRISDIRTWQWEDLNFKIEDAESGSISFICRDYNMEHESIG
jgi:hypothetical protein